MGFVVINNAYLLNCVLPISPGMNNCKLPTRCPNKKTIKNKPDSDAIVFLKIVDIKYLFIANYWGFHIVKFSLINFFTHED